MSESHIVYRFYQEKMLTVHCLRLAYINFSPGRRSQTTSKVNSFFPKEISNLISAYSGGAPYYDSRLDPPSLFKLRVKLVNAMGQCIVCYKVKQACRCCGETTMTNDDFLEIAMNIAEKTKK
jgi:hypothetical protein